MKHHDSAFSFCVGRDSHEETAQEKKDKKGGGIFENNCDCRDF